MQDTMTRHGLDRLRDLIARWQRNAALRRDLAAMSASDRAQLAGELGVSTDDLVTMAEAGDKASELMPARLRALGLDPDKLHDEETATYRDLERVCSRCQSIKRCTRDMAHGDIESGMREYCPNAPTMEALLEWEACQPHRKSA